MYIKRALAIYYLIYNLKKHSINKNFNLIFVWLLQWQKQFQLFHEFFTIQLVVSYLFVHIYFVLITIIFQNNLKSDTKFLYLLPSLQYFSGLRIHTINTPICLSMLITNSNWKSSKIGSYYLNCSMKSRTVTIDTWNGHVFTCTLVVGFEKGSIHTTCNIIMGKI